jgi:hypothetical protein
VPEPALTIRRRDLLGTSEALNHGSAVPIDHNDSEPILGLKVIPDVF